ncbi:MAG: hypothetical protein H0U05_05900 [Actinobacteria bacterium]|nr:hypothetical protein [Actinomycetota bacterium]
MRLRSYIAVVKDAGGLTFEYVVRAASRDDAEKRIREAEGHWGATLVELRPGIDRWKGTLRRPWIVAGITTALTAILIVKSVGAVL